MPAAGSAISRRAPGFARTAAAIYSLQVCGLYDDEMVKQGSEFLLKSHDRSWFSYGHFYAAPAKYMIGGETWSKWYEPISEELLPARAFKRMGDVCYWDPMTAATG